MVQGRELGGWWGGTSRCSGLCRPSLASGAQRDRSAKVVRTVPCAEGASPDSDPHRGLCGPLCRTPLVTAPEVIGARDGRGST